MFRTHEVIPESGRNHGDRLRDDRARCPAVDGLDGQKVLQQ